MKRRLTAWLAAEAGGIVLACLIWTAWENRAAEQRLYTWED